jgi:hypothetical protein
LRTDVASRLSSFFVSNSYYLLHIEILCVKISNCLIISIRLTQTIGQHQLALADLNYLPNIIDENSIDDKVDGEDCDIE